MYNNYYQPKYNNQQQTAGYQPYQSYQPYQPLYNQVIPSQPVQDNRANNLLGKSVDSIEVVKAMDIPLDGSISYFPLIDGSAIITKQVQNDGTSKIMIYKPTEEESNKFATIDFVKKEINELKEELLEQKSNKKKGE